MSDYSRIRDIFRAHMADFEASATLAEFAARTGKLQNYAGGWADTLFATDKARGIGALYKPLCLPTARRFSDLFEAATFRPTPEGGKPAPRQFDGWYFCSGNSQGAGVPIGQMGGTLSVREFPDGDVVRSRSGGAFHGTYVRPRAAVLDAWRANYGDVNPLNRDGFSLSSFEAIKRDDGILVVARDVHFIGSAWLALVDHGETLFDMLPDTDRRIIRNNQAAEAAAWGHLFTGSDGRTYADPAKAPKAEG